MHNKTDFFELYKPLRNSISNLCLEDSLSVIWAYSQHLCLSTKMPPEIETSAAFRTAENLYEKMVFPWELELLTKELIINARLGGGCKDSLKKWRVFSRAINKLKEFENAITGEYVNTDNIMNEMSRTAHRQFPWQSNVSKGHILRYYKIFNHHSINDMVVAKLGLSVYQLYLLGFMFFGFYVKHAAMALPIDLSQISQKDVNPANIDNFLKCFAKEYADIRNITITEQELNDKYAFSYSSLRAYPLITFKDNSLTWLACPLPTLLYWRFTGGLYYELINNDDFGNYWGDSFQSYIGSVIKTSNTNVNIGCLPEESYIVNKHKKATIDWIVYDKSAALFIECKTKRLANSAKVELADQTPKQNELAKMAKFIVQAYKTIDDYMKNNYPSLNFDKERQIYPILVTLEDWYLFSNEVEFRKMIDDMFAESKLPIKYLDEMPYTLCSAEEFEELIQIVQLTGIDEFMRGKVFDRENNTWHIREYIRNDFKQYVPHIKFLFYQTYEELFDQFVRDMRISSR